jgi:hypothetical protein
MVMATITLARILLAAHQAVPLHKTLTAREEITIMRTLQETVWDACQKLQHHGYKRYIQRFTAKSPLQQQRCTFEATDQ